MRKQMVITSANEIVGCLPLPRDPTMLHEHQLSAVWLLLLQQQH